MTQGDNWDEALAMAADALSGHISLCQADDYHIPAARSHEDLMEDAQVKEALVWVGPPTRSLATNDLLCSYHRPSVVC